MTAKSIYLFIEWLLGITLFWFLDVNLAIAFVCGMVIGGGTVYFLTNAKWKRTVAESLSKE